MWATLVVVASVGVVATVAIPQISSAAFTPHASLVPETPATGFPFVLGTPIYTEFNNNCPGGCSKNREVYGVDQAGRFIVIGGNFYEIELQDNSTVQQKYFAAWNIDTKQIACSGNFVFNGIVRSVTAAPTPGKVYVGGEFTKITDAAGTAKTRNKVALLDLTTCTVDNTFVSTGANGKVDEIAVLGSRVFVGGDFTAIGGTSVETVAELDGSTGAVKPAFNFPTSGELTSRVIGLSVNSAGNRLLVGGRFGTMTGNGRSIAMPTAVIDISNAASPTLTAHSSAGGYNSVGGGISDLQDVSISPDGSVFGLVFGSATVSDYVYLTPSTESAIAPRWKHYMRDSGFGIGVSNNAVYVGGHFCYLDPGPGAYSAMSAKMGLNTCTGSQMGGSGAWRSHLAALSLTDGTPLTWNPGQNSFTGSRRITVTTRGLLIGYDGDRTNSIRTGALAFLDFGPGVEDTTAPSNVTFTAPTAGASVNNPATISGTATDNVGVAKYTLTVQATSDNRYLQADGTLAAAVNTFTVTAAAAGSFTIALNMPAGVYTAKAKAVDAAGLNSALQTSVTFTETGIETSPPVVAVTAPATAVTGVPVSVIGTATDNVSVSTVNVQVRNAAGLYLQNDRTFAATANDYTIAITGGALGTPSVAWSADLGSALPVDTYTTSATATDASANTGTATATTTITAAPANVNLSIHRPATQGSGFFNSSPASRAVDGNTDGNLSHGSVSSTGSFGSPWWQVDLGSSQALNNIVLYKRTDCCPEQLTNFYVFVSNSDMTGRSLSSLIADANVWKYQYAGGAPTQLTIPAVTSGRYVRVVLSNRGTLSLAEVEVRSA